MESYFKLKEHGTTVKTEVLAGSTTFFAMAYIIFVNPNILSHGNPQIFDGVFFATCISAAIGTLLLAFFTNLPFAQAPGMGLNVLFAFTAMPTLAIIAGDPQMDIVTQYQMALALVFISGLLFILITAVGLREAIIDAIPQNIKIAIGGGIGIFICFLGLQSAGLVSGSPITYVDPVKFTTPVSSHSAMLALFGLITITILSIFKIKGAILISIVATTALSYFTGFSVIQGDFTINISAQAKNFFDVSFFKLDFATIFSGTNMISTITAVLVLILSLSMIDVFGSIGTFLGAASQAGLLDENGKMPSMRKALMCDAVATTVGALLGASTVTAYVESGAGMAEGGKTGLASLVTGSLFFVALFFAPFIGLVPGCATAPALIYVGYLMLSSIVKVNFKNIAEGFPAFLTIVIMPLTFSIANGIAFGIISYVLIKTLTGKVKEVKIFTWIIAILFIAQYFVPIG